MYANRLRWNCVNLIQPNPLKRNAFPTEITQKSFIYRSRVMIRIIKLNFLKRIKEEAKTPCRSWPWRQRSVRVWEERGRGEYWGRRQKKMENWKNQAWGRAGAGQCRVEKPVRLRLPPWKKMEKKNSIVLGFVWSACKGSKI